MTKLDSERMLWTKNGFRVEVANAPKEATTFDKMIIVYADKNIRRVTLYSTKEDRIIGQY